MSRLLPLPPLLATPAGCNTRSPTPASQQAAAAAPPGPGMGKVVISRQPAFRGGGVITNVYVDGRIVGVIGQGKFMVASVTPGEHISPCGTEMVPFRIATGWH